MRFVGPTLVIGTTLIVADLHLGFEDRREGSVGLITRSDEVLEAVRGYVRAAGAIDRVVFNGDVLDDFALSRPESRIMVSRLLRAFAAEHDLTLVRGNHDPMLGTLHIGVPLVSSERIDATIITHGDRALEEVLGDEDAQGVERIVIGHEHPALTLSDGIRTERFKCFVRIPNVRTAIGACEVIVMPSAHPDIVGTEVTALRSPIIPNSYDDAEVIVVGDPARSFGTIGSLRK
jgi:uncharacterized protein